MAKKPKFQRGDVVVVPKSCVKKYTLRSLGTPGVVYDILYSKELESFVYEISFTDAPHFEFIREQDLVAREPKKQ